MYKFLNIIVISTFPRFLFVVSVLATIVACGNSSSDNGGGTSSIPSTACTGDNSTIRDYTGYIHTTVTDQDADTQSYAETGRIDASHVSTLAYGSGRLYASDDDYTNTGDNHIKAIDPVLFLEEGRIGASTIVEMEVREDGYLYYLSVGAGLNQVNIDNPQNMFRTDRILINGLDADIYGSRLLTAEYSDGLLIYDLNQISTVSADMRVQIGHLSLNDNQARSIEILHDNIVVVATRGDNLPLANGHVNGGGLYILNIENPDSIEVLNLYDPDKPVWDVAVSGQTAYLAKGTEIEVLNLCTPTAPALIATIEVPGFATDIRINEGYAVAALGSGGTLLHEIRTAPTLENLTLIPRTAGSSHTAIYHDGNVYIAEQTALLKYEPNMVNN